VCVLVCWEIDINASQFSRTALKPQPVFWCKRQHFQSLSNLSSIIVHLPGWYENNEEGCVFISEQLCRALMLNFRIVGDTYMIQPEKAWLVCSHLPLFVAMCVWWWYCSFIIYRCFWLSCTC